MSIFLKISGADLPKTLIVSLRALGRSWALVFDLFVNSTMLANVTVGRGGEVLTSQA